ncbi:hypothetical protein HYFRA_00007638 [Hymenoscyphus fraxineus]|uniref:DUF6594 domain-containing protein n=1 Tax=Hymenoscyphus fraxineus TaxID=746836 RepID=A0A9N9PHD2_9HELO|nr:hypothetical protein HYFRA_00007638 [Hymenoscyphus fraxineus]
MCEDLMEKGEAGNIDVLTPTPSRSAVPKDTGTTEPPPSNAVEIEYVRGGIPGLQKLSRVGTSFRSFQKAIGRIPSGLSLHEKTQVIRRESVVRELDSCPEGYPRLAAFIDSDENFMLYRRFGFLQTRLLLNKQAELREYEKDLDRIDEEDRMKFPKRLKSREKDNASDGRRKVLLHDIQSAWVEYVQLLNAARDMATYNRPSPRDYLSVKNYFDEEAPVSNPENYIYCKEDIITLKPGRENAWLDAAVENILQRFSCKFIQRLFSSSELLRKTDPNETGILLYSRGRISVVVSIIILAAILVLLIVPVYILWRLTRSVKSGEEIAVVIVVLLVFTLVFSGILRLFTRAKRHEILAASAAYCAVLVVFVGNVGQLTPALT